MIEHVFEDLEAREWKGFFIRHNKAFVSVEDVCRACNTSIKKFKSFRRSRKAKQYDACAKDAGIECFVEIDGELWIHDCAVAQLARFFDNYELQIYLDQWLIWDRLGSISGSQENAYFLFGQAMSVLADPANSSNIPDVLITEFNYRDCLQSKLGGDTEVVIRVFQDEEYLQSCSAKDVDVEPKIEFKQYRVDLITDSHLFEIKTSRYWLQGLQQVNTYGTYYPTKQKGLVLFELSKATNLPLVKSHCEACDVQLFVMKSNGEFEKV